MIDLDNQTSFNFNLDELEKIVTTLSNKDIELLIVDNQSIKKINYIERNINKHTDVLSFPIYNMPLLGSIVISYDYIQNGAKKYNHELEDELKLLFIHGLLHLIGFDHEVDHGQMRDKEQEIIEHFNLPSSLIIRSIDE